MNSKNNLKKHLKETEKKRVKLKINFIIKFKQLLSKEDEFSIKKQNSRQAFSLYS